VFLSGRCPVTAILSLFDRIYREIDGDWYFDPKPGGGCLSAHTMRVLAEEIDRRNQRNGTRRCDIESPTVPPEIVLAARTVSHYFRSLGQKHWELGDVMSRRDLPPTPLPVESRCALCGHSFFGLIGMAICPSCELGTSRRPEPPSPPNKEFHVRMPETTASLGEVDPLSLSPEVTEGVTSDRSTFSPAGDRGPTSEGMDNPSSKKNIQPPTD